MIDAIRFSGDIGKVAKGRVAVLPAGSIENHGPHGYLGVDSLIAQRIAEAVAQRLDAILLPRVDYTWCPEMNRSYAGTLSVPQKVMQDYYTAILDGVLDWGVAGVLCICGHNGNLGPFTVAADIVGDNHPDQFVLSINWWDTWPENESNRLLGFTENGGHGHGGPLEMSAAWAAYPDGVHPDLARDISVADIRRHPVLRVLHHAGAYPSWNGYHGKVGETSREKGEVLIERAVDHICRDLQAYRSRL